jgi:hypothetical protein
MKSTEFAKQMTGALRIAKAKMAIQVLEKYNKEPIRSQIRTNIRNYERKIGV